MARILLWINSQCIWHFASKDSDTHIPIGAITLRCT